MKSHRTTPPPTPSGVFQSIMTYPAPKWTGPDFYAWWQRWMQQPRYKLHPQTTREVAITYIDQTFHTYSPSLQGAWNTAASMMPGSRICGCPRQQVDGQRFHRHVNLPIVLAGGPINPTPPATGGWSKVEVNHATRTSGNPAPGSSFNFQSDDPSANCQVLFRFPGGNNFGAFITSGAGSVTYPYAATSPIWTLKLPGTVAWCTSTIGGLPSSSGTVQVQPI